MQSGEETHKQPGKSLRVCSLKSCLAEGQAFTPRREWGREFALKFCSPWPVRKLQTERAQVAPGVALRLPGRVVRPEDGVRSALREHARLVNLATAGATALWSRPSCQAVCWVDRDKGYTVATAEVRGRGVAVHTV